MSDRARLVALLEGDPAGAAAFVRRADVVARALRPQLPPSNGVAAALDALAAAVEHPWVTRRLGRAFLAVTGRYLDASGLDALVSECASLDGQLARVLTRDLVRAGAYVEVTPIGARELLVDVSHTELYPHMSGIQRVVRRLCAGLLAQGNVHLVRGNARTRTLELLAPDAVARFLDFRPAVPWRRRAGLARLRGGVAAAARALAHAAIDHLPIVDPVRVRAKLKETRLAHERSQHDRGDRPVRVPLPLGSALLVPEVIVSDPVRVETYLALGRQHDVRVGAILYDLIPVFQPEFSEPANGFIDYLRVLRVVDRVSCISEATRSQVAWLLEQTDRSSPPVLGVHRLAGDFARPVAPMSPDVPVVLCVGTFEERKNQLGVLRAATLLWRRERRCRLVFAGNPGWRAAPFLEEAARCRGEGLPVELHLGPSEAELRQLYADATFTVFCSFAEGFGLPIVESLAFGRPCLTSSIGSMAEIAAGGGCLTADPHSPSAIADAMERLLSDPELRARLEREIAARPPRTWADYVREVHAFFTQP